MSLGFIMVWAVAGFLAYGLMKGQVWDYIRGQPYVCHCLALEMWCLVVGVAGFFGLILGIVCGLSNGFHFCLRMPLELKKRCRKF